VREAVNRIRRGEVVSAAAVEAVRGALRAHGFPGGRRTQEDAAECFSYLVDALGAPFLPLQERLLHAGVRDREGGDERVGSERLLWLGLGRLGDGEGMSFGRLLEAYFFGDRIDGLRRSEVLVDAWKHRRVLPYYTPVASTGEVAGVNDARAFAAVAVPFALARFDGDGRKTRARVPLPRVVDFSDFVEGVAARSYSLVLRSVVCHLGASRASGHYVAWTFDPFCGAGWRRWDDMQPGAVERVADGALSSAQAEELERDAYLVLYELVPGDGTTDPRDAFFHVDDVDVLAMAEDDRTFARALQAIEFENVGAQCHMQ
jgi:hypothetical protein